MKAYHLLAICLLLLSCQKSFDAIPEPPPEKELVSDKGYSISPETALENLEAFLSSDPTRSASTRFVKSITPIVLSDLRTRSDPDESGCDTLLYVVNFGDEEDLVEGEEEEVEPEGEECDGYAILAGDERLEDVVMAIVEEGTMDADAIYEAIDAVLSEQEEAEVFDEYPTTGPGFFTTLETEDEVFMNPNTVSLYDENEQDWLVGNISIDVEEELEGDDNYVPQVNARRELSIVRLTSRLIADYAISLLCRINPPDGPGLVGGGLPAPGVLPPTIRKETVVSPWQVTRSVSPMLTDFVDWHQRTPFNDSYPRKRKFGLFGKSEKAPAGCFPLALAKVMTFFERPNYFSYNGVTVDWDEMKQDYLSYIGSRSAAALLRGISVGSDSQCFYHGTFTFPAKIKSYMRNWLGFSNVDSRDYEFYLIESMLDDGFPVIAYAVPGINITKAHSWNIDGYMIKQRTTTTNTYENNVLTDSEEVVNRSYLVHCDFGWRGLHNGYYVSGIFRLNDPSVILDNPLLIGDGTNNYDDLLKIIRYEVANN